MLRYVILIEGQGAQRLARSLIVFQADGWATAKERAIAIGTARERTYVGGTGEEVRWRLEAVETLDELGASIADGREVYAEPVELSGGRTVAFDTRFRPTQSQPTQSGV